MLWTSAHPNTVFVLVESARIQILKTTLWTNTRPNSMRVLMDQSSAKFCGSRANIDPDSVCTWECNGHANPVLLAAG